MVKGHPQVIFSVDTERAVMALNDDDRPDAPSHILYFLARYHDTATVFVIAGRIPGYQALMRKMVS
jgi:peptidoglycan/xylan/chitin deacetylase (PgdA/CDA1 family)